MQVLKNHKKINRHK